MGADTVNTSSFREDAAKKAGGEARSDAPRARSDSSRADSARRYDSVLTGLSRRDEEPGGGTDEGATSPTESETQAQGGQPEAENSSATSGKLANITGEALSRRSAGDGTWGMDASDRSDYVAPGMRGDGPTTPSTGTGGASGSERSDANLTVSSTVTTRMAGQPKTRAVSAFGGMVPVFDFVNLAWTRSGNTVAVTVQVDCSYPYGTAGGSCVDVPSGTDSVVTAANHAASGRKVYEQIKTDLTPRSASPHKSPRDYFWSEALTDQHERYHGTDDYSWASGTGQSAAQAYINTQSVASGDVATALGTVITETRRRMYRGSDEYYWGGASDPGHSARTGEVRAYGDGRASYTALANAAEAHGQSLERAASGSGGG